MAEPVAVTIALSLLYTLPYWVAALVLAWITHEAYIHRGMGIFRQLARRQMPWSPHLLGHGSAYIPSYVVFFLGYLSLMSFVVPLVMILASGHYVDLALHVLLTTPWLGIGIAFLLFGFWLLRRSAVGARSTAAA